MSDSLWYLVAFRLNSQRSRLIAGFRYREGCRRVGFAHQNSNIMAVNGGRSPISAKIKSLIFQYLLNIFIS